MRCLIPSFAAYALVLLALIPGVASAQNLASRDAQMQEGRIATSTVGVAGQRQTRYQSALGIAPSGRVASRIQNRIDTRLHTRIDHGYTSVINGTAAYRAAAKEVMSAGRRDELGERRTSVADQRSNY